MLRLDPKADRDALQFGRPCDVATLGVEGALQAGEIAQGELGSLPPDHRHGPAGRLRVVDEILPSEETMVERLAGQRMDMVPVLADRGLVLWPHRRVAPTEGAHGEGDGQTLRQMPDDRRKAPAPGAHRVGEIEELDRHG